MKINQLLCLFLIVSVISKQLRFLQEKDVASDVSKGISLMNMAMNSSPAIRFCGHVGMIIDAIATVFETFSSSTTTTLAGIREGEGYKEFIGTIEFDFTVGYRQKGYQFFMDDMFASAKIPDAYKNDFIAVITEGEYTKRSESFADFNFAYNKEEKDGSLERDNDDLTYLSITIQKFFDTKTHKAKFNAIVITATAHFRLMPDELIYRTTKKVAGGITNTQTLHSEWRNKNLTPEDMDQIMQYFQYTGYSEFLRYVGMNTKVDMPDL